MGEPTRREPTLGDPESAETRTGVRTSGLPKLRLRLARWAILWERLWPALWPATFIAGLFLLVALFDLFAVLPGWLHLIALIGFVGAFLAALSRGIAEARLPDAAAGRRRVERESGLSHRPLTALDDRLAGGVADPEAAALWQAYQRRLRGSLPRLRVGFPRAGLARRDPWGLRAALGLLLVIAVTAGWGDGWNRLSRAAMPDLAGAGQDLPPKLILWITPPAYTRIAPLFVDTAEELRPTLTVPEGSTVLAQVEGGRGTPSLTIGEAAVAFAEIGTGTYRVDAAVLTGDRLAVEQGGRQLGAWPLRIVPDQPPTATFATPPTETERTALRIEFEAQDDYGLKKVWAVIRRVTGEGGAGGNRILSAETIELPLPLPGIDQPEARAASYHDLTPHPWAGLPVEMRLTAQDSADQTGRSAPMTLTLPERIFHHPVARAIIEQRKRLTVAPEDRDAVGRALARIAAATQAYDGDIVVTLTLRIAQRRLETDRTGAELASVQDLLWDTALRLEDGNLTIAERELRAAQQALQEALAREDTTDAEIERLMDELQQALDQFLAALTEQMERQLAEGQEPQPLDPNATMLQQEDLQRLLDQAREMARSGARDAAREMLAQLQEMLENLQSGMFAGEPQQGAAEAMQMMQDLEALTQHQQELLDRSFRQSQQMQPGEQSSTDGAGAREQEGLRRALGDIMRRFGEMTGEIPGELGRGERAMREAVDALERGAPGEAVAPQSRALDELQQAMGAMAETLAQQLGRQPGQGQGQFGRAPLDPLGRNQPGQGLIDTGDVEIPEEADLQRAREILDELRRRAGELERPRPEREYIDRLLRRF
ncbi:TIGR02302 family protein [Rhodospirillaceae bacterium SYSU D60014]|uniref:TIGR02302 family protein n=1 Tax=Virgifigura deserti TaxID=2268457 RepID=UPI000E666043